MQCCSSRLVAQFLHLVVWRVAPTALVCVVLLPLATPQGAGGVGPYAQRPKPFSDRSQTQVTASENPARPNRPVP
jgi:hypothetical protein